MQSDGLAGYGVLVTGGGTGIGKACAAEAARQGAKVMICGRTQSKLEEVAKALAADGLSVELTVADVTVEEDVVAATEATVAFAGNLKGVVANAGGGGMLAPYHHQDVEEFRRVLILNVVGTMLCVKHSVPHLVAAGGGSFVGMSSIAATATHPVFGAYPVAKAGIDAMMRNAADEYGPAGVRFNSVQPGFVATEIMEGIPRDSSVFDSYLVNTPLGGVSEPADVASVVAFLLGPASGRITGQSIAVDGGHNLRAGPDFRPFTGLTPDQLLARRTEP
ncbi:MAG TPA: SDR family oxidoreductase [Acidimicrobiales bacterium]|nr:SDR family oxidoreductase [Acidimicrobiales bacterium]